MFGEEVLKLQAAERLLKAIKEAKDEMHDDGLLARILEDQAELAEDEDGSKYVGNVESMRKRWNRW